MDFLTKGKEVEQQFAKTLSNPKQSNKDQDINEHWDIANTVTYDVKAMKKINRSDNHPNENIHWVEIKNVHGNNGWLYGKADYIVFETEDYWFTVPTPALQSLISKKTVKQYTEYPTLYRLYTRKGRKDIITLVKTIDLIYIGQIKQKST